MTCIDIHVWGAWSYIARAQDALADVSQKPGHTLEGPHRLSINTFAQPSHTLQGPKMLPLMPGSTRLRAS